MKVICVVGTTFLVNKNSEDFFPSGWYDFFLFQVSAIIAVKYERNMDKICNI